MSLILRAFLHLLLLAYAWALNPVVNVNRLGSEPEGFIYFTDSPVFLYLLEDGAGLRRSDDDGKTWKTVDLPNKEPVIRLVEHQFDHNKAYAFTASDKHFVTNDQGSTWTEFQTPAVKMDSIPGLSFHADNHELILATGSECKQDGCQTKIFYTTDNFKTTPKLLHDKLKLGKCIFGKGTKEFELANADSNTIVCLVENEDVSKMFQLTTSSDFFRSFEVVKINDKPVEGVEEMGLVNKFLVAAVRKDQGSEHVDLVVTTNLISWKQAVFPDEYPLLKNSYTILESSTHSLHIDMGIQDQSNQMPETGTFFTSNSDGTYFTKRLENTNRSPDGFVDIEKIDAIDGVLIANVVQGKNGSKKNLRTMISYDDGRTWDLLVLSSPEGCNGDGSCSLNLHNAVNHHNIGKVFSSPAPGIIAGIGNIGDRLLDYEEGDMYLSEDTGRTWKLAQKGPHLYEFGDQGNIVVSISEAGHTNEIYLSDNRGLKWEKAELPISVEPYYLFTTPDSTSMNFILMGLSKEKSDFVTISVSFDNLYNRKCEKDDFEKWYARYNSGGQPNCIMGHKQFFWRKKLDAKCAAGDVYHEQIPASENCDCSEEDFECDTNFYLSSGKCVPTLDYDKKLRECKAGSKYDRPSGYRLIPGNTCEKGEKSSKLDQPISVICGEEDNNNAPNVEGISVVKQDFEGRVENFYYLNGSPRDPEDETILVRTNRDTIFISHDQGITWKQILETEKVVEVYPNKYFPDVVYLTTGSGSLYLSEDRAKNFQKVAMPTGVTLIPAMNFDSKDSKRVLYTGEANCENIFSPNCIIETFYSNDGGRTWRELVEHSRYCTFVNGLIKPTAEALIFCSVFRDGKMQLQTSTDYFNSFKVPFDDIVGFALERDYLIVASVVEGKDNVKELAAHITVDGDTFALARFPANLRITHQTAYTILESKTKSLFMHVTESDRLGGEYGALLKSNSNGTDYVLSSDGVSRSTAGFVDFERMFGLEGVAILNTVMNKDEAGVKQSKRVKSKITFNDGSKWSYIPPPENAKECSGSLEKCSLNLHGYTEQPDLRDTSSSQSAVGLMLGIGNVGEYIEYGVKTGSNTYMTRDGGVSWIEVKKGVYMWEFGDSGGIVVIVDYQNPTDTLFYSFDMGHKWNEYKFSQEKVQVDDLTTVPSDTSRKFLLFGRLPAAHEAKSFTLSVDFSGLTKRKCVYDSGDPNKDDFDLWTPQYPGLENGCLFGHQASYHRKIPGRNCFVGRESVKHIEKPHEVIKNCTCTREDFECDFNYFRAVDGTCKLVPGFQPPDHSDICREYPGTVEYWVPTGYRRVPISTCAGGLEYDKIENLPCPGMEDKFNKKKKGLGGFGLFVVITLPIGMAGVICWIVWDHYSRRYGQIRLGEDDGDKNVFIQNAIIAINGLIAVVSLIPEAALALFAQIQGRFSGRISRYTTRSSFARSNHDYNPIEIDDEVDILRSEDYDQDVEIDDDDLEIGD